MRLHAKFIHLILWVSLLISCKKQDVDEISIIRSFNGEYNSNLYCVVKLDDGNFLMGSQNINISVPGKLIKTGPDGRQIWKKDLPLNNMYLIKSIAVPGKGFLTYGFRDFMRDTVTYLNLFDYEGNLIKTDSIVSGQGNFYKMKSNILRLSNGNFMVVEATVDWVDNPISVYTLAPDLSKLKVREVIPSGFLYIMLPEAMCELADGHVGIALSAQDMSAQYENVLMLKFKQDGDHVSSKWLTNNDSTETANDMIPFADGALMVSSKMKGVNYGDHSSDQDHNGIMINYDDFYFYENSLASGRIFLSRLNASLDITETRQIKGYPKNGMINSIRKTADGGYILCGTVNQQGTTLVVSDTRIYLVRLDAGLNVTWTRIIHTTYPAIGRDAIQTDDGGILVFGFQKSFGKKSNVLVVKTDADGNL